MKNRFIFFTIKQNGDVIVAINPIVDCICMNTSAYLVQKYKNFV